MLIGGKRGLKLSIRKMLFYSESSGSVDFPFVCKV